MSFVKFHNKTKPKFENKKISKVLVPYIWKFNEIKEYPRFTFYPFSNILDCRKTLFNTLLTRKSERISFKKIDRDKLSTLLFYSCAVKNIYMNHKNISYISRMYPSAGARFPTETYVAIPYKLNSINRGLYHYDPLKHGLTKLPPKTIDKEIIQKFVGKINAQFVNRYTICIVLTSVFYRGQLKYGNEPGYRYSLIEVGHIGQNIYLVATALNLAVFSIGGYNDNYVNKFLDLDERIEQSLYLFLVGGKNKN